MSDKPPEKPPHPHGHPENVLKFSSDNKVVIDDAPLKKMFEHPDVKNRKMVAFSIIGAYRKGKSFFLDYCLRFLYAHVSMTSL
jgi:atlastin